MEKLLNVHVAGLPLLQHLWIERSSKIGHVELISTVCEDELIISGRDMTAYIVAQEKQQIAADRERELLEARVSWNES